MSALIKNRACCLFNRDKRLETMCMRVCVCRFRFVDFLLPSQASVWQVANSPCYRTKTKSLIHKTRMVVITIQVSITALRCTDNFITLSIDRNMWSVGRRYSVDNVPPNRKDITLRLLLAMDERKDILLVQSNAISRRFLGIDTRRLEPHLGIYY